MNRDVEVTTETINTLTNWAREELSRRNWGAPESFDLSPLTGDAGFRRYFRVPSEPALLAVFAPPAAEKNEAFCILAEHFIAQGIHAPSVLAVDYEQGFLLLEDFGDVLFQSELTDDSVDMLYGEALLTLLRLQQCSSSEVVIETAAKPPQSFVLPEYSVALLKEEMDLFGQWFVPKLLGYDISGAEQSMLKDTFSVLLNNAIEQPQVWVHRDFHSRNLIYREGQAPGVIDFQDAVHGPITYDLVSLLRDCYVRWDAGRVERWALAYGNMAEDVGLVDSVCQKQWLQWFDLMGLQRHIKVLGIFSRLYLRDGKSGYLNDLPLVIRYVLEVAEKYPELTPFVDWFKSVLLPLCEKQDWYSDYRLAGE